MELDYENYMPCYDYCHAIIYLLHIIWTSHVHDAQYIEV